MSRRLRVLTPEEEAAIDRRPGVVAAMQRVRNIAAQIAYHGPGLTFGELAIGECFTWAPPIPRGPEPIVKTAEDRYAWSRGYGTAEDFYRVERWTD